LVLAHRNFSPPALRRARLDAGLSQQGLSVRAGLYPNLVGYLERGQVQPMASTAVALADALDLPLDALFEPTRSPSPRRWQGFQPG
jgi:transcriptional regulator with XRE-family HTH domain